MKNKLNRHFLYPKTDKVAEELFWKYKKKDPFPNIAPALLNSADIADYVAHTGMVYPFEPSRLGPASYEMVLGGEYLYWDEDGKKIIRNEIKNNDELVLKKNSITYVSVLETFRIPNYIALRFNLRVKHVHRGLLLGTGPLVDPGFHGNLMIPIHNLTNNEYYIKANEDLISVEFTKVSPNQAWKISNEEIIVTKGQYVENSGKNSKKSFEELLKSTLPVGVGKVMSSFAGTLAESRKEISSFTGFRRFAYWTAGAVFLALLTVFITTFQVVSDANKYVSDASTSITKLEQEDLDIREILDSSDLGYLRTQIEQFSSDIKLTKENEDRLSKIIDSEFRTKIDTLTKEIESLRDDVKMLRASLLNQKEGKK